MANGLLGFGMMRLPVVNGNYEKIDHAETCKLVDKFLEKGFTYFDTSYVYHNGFSEEAARECLVKRHPRDSFTLATKLPTFNITKKEQVSETFEQQLKNCGVDYFDYYLLHTLNVTTYDSYVEPCGMFDFIKRQKEGGRIRHIGFSFHDSAEMLDRILTEHPETEFVQIVVNYFDWESRFIQARKCYETIRKHGKKVVIMEPVKGGMLANFPPGLEKEMKAVQPNLSAASWAIRFGASLDGVIAVLSGMSTMEQVEDNTSYMENFVPLSRQEKDLLTKGAAAFRKSGPLHTDDFGKYEGICENGMPAAAVLEAYNASMIQPVPTFGADLCYYKCERYRKGLKDGEIWMDGNVFDKDGNDITEMLAKAEKFLLEHIL